MRDSPTIKSPVRSLSHSASGSVTKLSRATTQQEAQLKVHEGSPLHRNLLQVQAT